MIPRLALALTLLAGPCLAQSGLGPYLPPGTPAVDGLRHLVLIYHGQQRRPVWNQQNLLPYVAYLDEQGRPQDWLFDGFLFIEFATDDGVYIHHHLKDKRLPTIADWQWLADCWFRPDRGLIGLQQATAEAGAALGQPDRVSPVVITLPLPLTADEAFGPLPGAAEKLNLSVPENRRRALAWYIDTVRRQFDEHRYRHLKLAGFYWTAESIPAADRELATWTSAYLKGLGLHHYWIPFNGAQGIRQWRECGFAGMMIQPNYFFRTPPPPANRFMTTAKMARLVVGGIEMEFDGRALTSDDFHHRMLGYLDAGVAYGWMKDALIGWYEGGGAILQLVKSPGRGRDLYRKVYEFIKGTYQPSGEWDFSTMPLVVRDNSDNRALAGRGAKIIGAPKRPEWGDEIGPEKLNDGEIDGYGGMSGFAAFFIPGSVTVELPQPTTVARTQTMFFEYDGRFFHYRVDTSVDGEAWQSAVDKREGEWRGWQVDEFPPRAAKFIRLTVLHNSTNAIASVVEFEVYATAE
ncbi:MAG: DUF4855 domain-containing protein [Armatimonadetes bacterium]|nr:DUF4855 domain-containing protein [Armatimonadota bacterium]